MAMVGTDGILCAADLNQIAREDENRLTGSIAQSAARNNPWINSISGGTFPAGVSAQQQSIVSMPAAPGDNAAIPEFICKENLCGVKGPRDSVDTITHTVRLEGKRGRGPKVCVHEGYNAFKGQYEAAAMELKKLIPNYVDSDIRAQLYLRGGTKFVANSGYDFESLLTGGFDTDIGVQFLPVLPDSPMSFKALQALAQYLSEIALAPFYNAGRGQPHYRVIAGLEQLNRFRDEADVQGAATALAQGGFKFGEEVLTGYSFETAPAFRGLAFANDQTELRVSGLDGNGVPIIVNPYTIVEDALTGRAYRKPSAAWKAARYAIGAILADGSFERQVPENYIGEGPFKFAPQLFSGELKWHNLEDNDCNLWADFGWHKYQIIRAYKPLRPHYAVHFLYMRPLADLGLVPVEDDSLTSYSGSDVFTTVDECLTVSAATVESDFEYINDDSNPA
jgi:hypothetical protein